MKFARKVGFTLATATMTIGLVGIATPAEAARDTSWGCGGACFAGMLDLDIANE